MARAIEILLVEDNPGDVELTRANMARWKAHSNLYVVEDGEEALAFLRNEGSFADRPRPDLILLDLNLPKLDGRGLLEIIKDDPALHEIPVLVLTSSDAESDVAKSYELHANCYVRKPVELEQFTRMVRSIEEFWISVVTLPPKDYL